MGIRPSSTVLISFQWIIKPNLIFLGLHVVIAKRTDFPVCYHRITDIRKSMQTHCSSRTSRRHLFLVRAHCHVVSTPGTTSKPLGRPALVRRETPGLFCISSPALPKKLLDTIWQVFFSSICEFRTKNRQDDLETKPRPVFPFYLRYFANLTRDKGIADQCADPDQCSVWWGVDYEFEVMLSFYPVCSNPCSRIRDCD